MDLLVIGGTSFAGRSLGEQALAAGHDVTLFHRHPTDVLPGAEHVLGDREQGVDTLADRRFDAVVDMCGYVPRSVRASARALLASGWYGFVSSISAHVEGLPAGVNEDSPLHEPPPAEVEEVTAETYGPLKVACEREVREAFGDRAAVVRPGYIVGPNDPTDRLTSWVRRAAQGGRMAAPAPPEAPVQFVDARDLAAFLLRLAETATAGTYDVVHPPGTCTRSGLCALAAEAGGADTEIVWMDPAWLTGRLGEDRDDAFPMWDEPDDPDSHRFDPSRALAAGLTTRPVAETVGDTLAWDRARGDEAARPCGLTPALEAELLDAWRGAGGP